MTCRTGRLPCCTTMEDPELLSSSIPSPERKRPAGMEVAAVLKESEVEATARTEAAEMVMMGATAPSILSIQCL